MARAKGVWPFSFSANNCSGLNKALNRRLASSSDNAATLGSICVNTGFSSTFLPHFQSSAIARPCVFHRSGCCSFFSLELHGSRPVFAPCQPSASARRGGAVSQAHCFWFRGCLGCPGLGGSIGFHCGFFVGFFDHRPNFESFAGRGELLFVVAQFF